MTSGDQKVAKFQIATFEVAKRVMEAILLKKTHWPILSDYMYSRVDEARKLVIEAQYCQRALPGAPAGTPSGCQMPGGPSLKIDALT